MINHCLFGPLDAKWYWSQYNWEIWWKITVKVLILDIFNIDHINWDWNIADNNKKDMSIKYIIEINTYKFDIYNMYLNSENEICLYWNDHKAITLLPWKIVIQII